MEIPEIEAFTTHLNYATCLNSLTKDLVLTFTPELIKKDLPDLARKDNLLKLTSQSLKDEYKIVQIYEEYSFASTAWLPIKSYHLIYNLLLKIAYIITCDKVSFNMSHSACASFFTSRLLNSELSTNNDVLNEVFDSSIFQFKSKTGEGLSKKSSAETHFKMAMKKVSHYKMNSSLRGKNLRTKSGKQFKENFLKSFTISFFEFPTYMRHRSSYRDFSFIDGVEYSDTKAYFDTYYSFIINLYNGLIQMQNELLVKRGYRT